MKERFALLAAYIKDKFAIGKKSGKEKRKSMLLSIVALVEVLAIAIVSVSAWVETISTVKIDLNNGTIDNYVFTNANIGYGDGYDGKSIDLTKYFRAAGDVHLSSATSANGRDIYFPTLTANGEASSTYRKATVNDKNVNYIEFSFNVTAKGTDAKFYFDKVPSIKVDDTEVDEEKVRVSFVCNGNSTVVCGKSNSTEKVVSGTNLNITEQENVKSFDSYIGSTAKNPLFTVPVDSKQKVTMRVWLQDDSRDTKYAGQTVTIDNFKLITQNQQTTEFTFSDKTTGDSSLGAGWATKSGRVIWIHQDGKSEYKKLSKDSSGNYSVELGSGYTDNQNATFTFYSCESTVTANPQNSYVAKWTTTLSEDVRKGSQTFTAYGYKDDSSNNGYGTWGEVQKILLSSEDTSTLPMTQVDGKYLAVDMYVQGSSTPIAMTFVPNDNASLSGWVAYLPDPNSDAAHSLTFKFTNNGKNYSIGAPNRSTSVNFVVTSANTGYWAPPVIISVYSPCIDDKDNNAEMGVVSVSGGVEGATRVKVTKGTTVTLNVSSNDSKKYRFIGWYSDSEFKNPVSLNESTYTTDDTTTEHKFYAKFARQYTVEAKAVSDGAVTSSLGGTVQISGGDAGSYAVGSYLEGENTSITAAAKEGYDFKGWYSDEACTDQVSQETTLTIGNIQANHLYYAKFMIKQFSVTAVAKHPNDKKDSTVQFSSPSSDASNTSVTVKVNYNGSATFVANAGEGYEFVGWYSDKTCQTLVSNKTPYTVSNIKADCTLYAKFKLIDLNLKVYSVTEGQISGVGGTVQRGLDTPAAKIETTVEWGTSVKLTATVANENYRFDGWFTDAACETEADNTVLNNCQYTDNVVETAPIKKDLTLYAKFTDITKRKVTANAVYNGSIVDTAGNVQAGNSDAGATSTTEVTNGEDTTLYANVKDGKYKFMGWYSDKECTDSVGENEQLAVTNVRADREYYALFKLQSFTVKAVVDSSSGTVKFTAPKEVGPSNTFVTVSVDYDGSATFVAEPDEGYDFDGWYKSDSTSPVSQDATYTVKEIESDFTLYARFKLKEFDVKASAVLDGAVSATGGTVQAGDTTAASTVSTPVKWGESITMTATPKTGYSFSGWYTDLACTKPYTSDYTENPLTTVIKAKTTVYAKFEQKRTLYLLLNDAWKTSNARYAAYVWTDGKDAQWFNLSQEDGDVYRVELTGEAFSWPNIIFVKMKPNTTENDWKNKDAQTKDLTIPAQSADTDCFKITGNLDDGRATGTWIKYPFDTFTVALDAVSYDSAGAKETSGFTGGKISFGGVQYTSAVTKTYSESTTITATAVCNDGYQFDGWYSDSDCLTKVASDAQFSVLASSSVHYYAKFVKSNTRRLYFTNSYKWSGTIYCYAWNDNDNNASYPGVKMTFLEKYGVMDQDVYYIDIDTSFTYVIFSNGSSNEKTIDISLEDNVNAYYVSGGSTGAYTVTKQKRN